MLDQFLMIRRQLPVRWIVLARAAIYVIPLALIPVAVLEWNGVRGQDRDSLAYHQAAAAAREGAPIYEAEPTRGPHEFVGRWPYIYPPPVAALLSFTPPVSYRTFDRAWLLANVAAFYLFAACLARLARGRWTIRGSLIWGAALFFIPGSGALLAIRFANIDIMILALVAAGLAVPRLAGFAVGCAAIFKIMPVWPLGVLLLRRRRSAVPGAAAAVVLCFGACFAAFGLVETWRLLIQWLTEVMPPLSQGQFWGESLAGLRAGGLTLSDYRNNLSLSFLPVQLAVLSGWSYHGGDLPAAVRIYLTGFAITVPLAVGWLTHRRSVNMQAAAVLAAAMLSAAIVRPYVLPVLLLLLAVWREERRLQCHLSGEPATTAEEKLPTVLPDTTP